MAGNSIKKQTPMRLFITEVLRPVTGEANEEDCINTFLRVSKYAMNGPYISNCINGYKNWTGQAKKAFSSKEVFNLLISLLEGKNYQQLLNKTLSQCETLTVEPADALVPMVYSDIFSLSSFFCQQNSPMLQKKFTATAVQAYLCYLTGANDSEKYWDEEVDSFFYNRESTSIKSQGRAQGGNNCSPNIVQILENNSREEFSRLQGLLKYKIEPKLLSTVNCDITRHNHLLLVGDGGAGKTSFLLDYWGKLLGSNTTETKALPIYVPLNRFEGNDEFFIRNYIKKHYFSSQNNLEFDNWLNSAKDCNIILLLDAINEAKNSRELGSEIEELCVLGCRIILTSRHEMEGWGSLEDFKRARLLPLPKKTVDEHLKEHKLEVSERLRPLLTKPMYLALVLKIGEEAKSVESPGELFLTHHKWIQRSFTVDSHGLVYHEIGKTAFETVLPKMATVIDTIKFKGHDVKTVIDNQFADEGWDYREVLNLFVDAGILTKERQTYLFSHEFYLDFYKAYSVYLEMQEDKISQVLGSSLISNSVAELLGELWTEYRFKDKDRPSHIEKWLQDNMVGKRGAIVKIVCRNLVETIKISCDNYLEGCCFNDLDLSLCNFYNVDLINTSFANANLSMDAFVSPGHAKFITSVIATPDKKHFITASQSEHNIKIWDFTSKSLLSNHYLRFPGPLAISNDGNTLIAGGYRWISVIDLPSNDFAEIGFESSAGEVVGIAITPDNKHVVTAHANSVVLLWEGVGFDCKIKQVLIDKHKDHELFKTASSVSVINNDFVATNVNGAIQIWNIGTGKCIKKLNGKATPWMVADSQKYRLFFINNDGTLNEYDLKNETHQVISSNCHGEVFWLDYCEKDNYLAGGIGDKIVLWDINSVFSEKKVSLPSKYSQIGGALGASSRVVVACLDNTIYITDLSVKPIFNQIHSHGSPEYQQEKLLSPDGRVLLYYNNYGQLIAHNVTEGDSLYLSLDGIVSFGELRTQSNNEILTPVNTPFSPDSSKFAFSQSSPHQSTFSIVDLVHAQREVADLQGEYLQEFTWATNNRLVCITNRNNIYLFDCFVDQLGNTSNYCQIVGSIKLDDLCDCRETYLLPDGSAIVILDNRNEVLVYDIDDGKLISIKPCSNDCSLRVMIAPNSDCAILGEIGTYVVIKKSMSNQQKWSFERIPFQTEKSLVYFGNSIVILYEKGGKYSVQSRISGKDLYNFEAINVVVSQDEKYVVCDTQLNTTLLICDAHTGRQCKKIPCVGFPETTVLSNAGSILAYVNQGGDIVVHNLESGGMGYLPVLDTKTVWNCDFSEVDGLEDYFKRILTMCGSKS